MNSRTFFVCFLGAFELGPQVNSAVILRPVQDLSTDKQIRSALSNNMSQTPAGPTNRLCTTSGATTAQMHGPLRGQAADVAYQNTSQRRQDDKLSLRPGYTRLRHVFVDSRRTLMTLLLCFGCRMVAVGLFLLSNKRAFLEGTLQGCWRVRYATFVC